MNNKKLNSKLIYTQLIVQINSYYKIDNQKYINNLEPTIPIKDFIKHLNLTQKDWWIILLSLEIDFKINSDIDFDYKIKKLKINIYKDKDYNNNLYYFIIIFINK